MCALMGLPSVELAGVRAMVEAGASEALPFPQATGENPPLLPPLLLPPPPPPPRAGWWWWWWPSPTGGEA